ncbi:ABC transporter ATP-binding protein [Arthrobacter sp. LjRoot14]|uniref:ABC transporter ATP-binding protein n=1 Tax=Arthrobacter sp. LjRoot14 TaxID=3342265 RepID=UPI003ECDE190
MTAAALLEARIEAFTYHGEDGAVLHDVAMAAAPGTLTAVLGGSGSGKSTLGRLLAGWLSGGNSGRFKGSLHLPATARGAAAVDSGPLYFHGSADDPRINAALWSEQVGFVPQDAAALLSTVGSTVAEELAFGLENRGMDRQLMRAEVAHAADAAGLTALLERDPATLSGGELRRLAVACSAITRPGVLVLDEPCGSLDNAGAASVRALVRGLLDSGTAVVVLSQTADELALSAGHWLVLDGGTVTACGTPGELAGGPALLRSGVVIAAPGGIGSGPRLPAAAPFPLPSSASRRPAGANAPAALLELEGVSFGYPARRRARRGTQETLPGVLGGLSLAVTAGEIVAVTGPNGAGKSTLLRHFNGLLRPDLGSVRIQGKDIAGIPTGRVADLVGLLFQHPRDQLFEQTALREVLFGLDRKFGVAAETKARAALAAVGLGDQLHIHPYELPASRQRLLALATVLAREPGLIALDEPTVGLDRHGLERLDEAVCAAAKRGAAVVMVTHELDYARATAHRVLELRNGTLREL